MLSQKQIQHLTKLANLSLNPGQIEKFRLQLNGVLEYMEELKKVDTSRVEPTSQVTGLENIFRQDQLESCLTQKQALSGTKNTRSGRIKVKTILERWNPTN